MPELSQVGRTLTDALPGWPEVANFAVYAAIAIVTLIGLFKCLIPLWSTKNSLWRAIRRLHEDSGNTTGKPVWQEPRFVGKRLRGVWQRFLQNAEQLDRRGLPTNVEDYINDDTVVHGPGKATLAELIPNLLTSLGILGTFMGLSSGLATLNFADSNALIAGIPALLSGMKFAFYTSVAGISCSIVFNMVNRISQGAGYHAIDEFVSNFTQLAMSRPLDNDVQMIIQNQDRNHMLAGINDTLADRLAENVGRAVTRAMTPVSDSMDRFIVAATRNQVEGVNRLVSRFLAQMDQELGGQFGRLSQVMDGITQRQIESAQRADDILMSAGGIVGEAKEMQRITGGLLAAFDAYMSELRDTRKRDEGFEARSAELLSRMSRENRDLERMISVLAEKVNRLDASVSGPEMKDVRDAAFDLRACLNRISDTLDLMQSAKTSGEA